MSPPTDRLWSKKDRAVAFPGKVANVVAPMYRGVSCRIIGRAEVNGKTIRIELSYNEHGTFEPADWFWAVQYYGTKKWVRGKATTQDEAKSEVNKVLDRLAHGQTLPR